MTQRSRREMALRSRFGQADSTPPLVLLQRFRGTLDHWDPAFLEVLASERRVVIFDSAGVGESTGSVSPTVEGMADSALDFIQALGFTQADILGWSLGGYVTQIVALAHPELVRRLLVTGSGPGGVPGTPGLEMVCACAAAFVSGPADLQCGCTRASVQPTPATHEPACSTKPSASVGPRRVYGLDVAAQDQSASAAARPAVRAVDRQPPRKVPSSAL